LVGVNWFSVIGFLAVLAEFAFLLALVAVAVKGGSVFACVAIFVVFGFRGAFIAVAIGVLVKGVLGTAFGAKLIIVHFCPNVTISSK
jgi:hypothetical protein